MNDALRNLIGMTLLFIGMLQKFRSDALGINAAGHKMMASVPQYTNDFSRQRFIQKLDYRLAVGTIAFGHSTILDVLPGAFAQSFNISEKWFVSHSPHSLLVNLVVLEYYSKAPRISTKDSD